jgi:cell wall integrity and stress response component
VTAMGTMSVGDVRVITATQDAYLKVATGTGEDLTALDAAFGSDFIRFMDSQEITTGQSSLATLVSNETSSRLSGDTSLASSLSTEASSRTSGDLSLTTSLSTKISTESSSRVSGDTSLATSLSTTVSVESSSRTSGDTSLATSITTEASSRLSGDTSLSTKVSQAESTLLSQDESLETSLTAEASSRLSGDTSLSTSLSSEASSRLSGDTSVATVVDDLHKVNVDSLTFNVATVYTSYLETTFGSDAQAVYLFITNGGETSTAVFDNNQSVSIYNGENVYLFLRKAGAAGGAVWFAGF